MSQSSAGIEADLGLKLWINRAFIIFMGRSLYRLNKINGLAYSDIGRIKRVMQMAWRALPPPLVPGRVF